LGRPVDPIKCAESSVELWGVDGSDGGGPPAVEIVLSGVNVRSK
jgi:hypothetical protein